MPARTDVDDGEFPKLTANFHHVEKLYATEEAMPLKVAHKLSVISLKPNNIQRTSPVHAKSKSNHSNGH